MSVFGIYACDIRLSWVGISVLITDYRSFFHKDFSFSNTCYSFFFGKSNLENSRYQYYQA